MKSSRLTFVLLTIVVLTFSVFFIVSQEPEAQEVTSVDGVVTVTGLTRTAQDFTVDVVDGSKTGEPLLSAIYRVEPANVPLDTSIVLSFAKTKEAGTATATTVYQWNTALGMWETVSTVVANTPDVLAVQITSLGDFALGTMPTIDAPTMLTSYDELHAKAPIGTRGYRIVVAYMLPNGVYVRLPDAGEIGGCGGRVGAGDRTEYSSTTAAVTVPVNDVSTPVEFIMVSEWAVSGDCAGCAASMPLKAQE